MRRTIFLGLGLLELGVCAGLVLLGCQIPQAAEVDQSFRSAEQVTNRAGAQVHLLQRQVRGLRRMELQQLSTRLQKETRSVTARLQDQSLDFETIKGMRDGLGEVADGLTGLAKTLDPDTIGSLGTALGETASFLDKQVIPGARRTAKDIDQSTGLLRDDARRLEKMLRETPPSLQPVREVYKSLARFQEGLDKMDARLDPRRLETMKEGFRGLETALSTGAEQVERLADYSYPVVSINGLRVEVNQKSFWPEGSKIAQGMRKAAAGATAAQQEMNGMAADLPKVREGVLESRNVVGKVRESLAVALERQDKIDQLLKQAPANAARLADQLPKLGTDLAAMLRDTGRLDEVAKALRQSQLGIERASARWPELRRSLERLAYLLRASQDQLDRAIKHRKEYEATLQETIELADSFATLLPLVTDQLDSRLDEEERTLTDLGQSLDEASAAVPVYAHTTSRLLETGKLLAWLVAAIVGLHGCYLLLSVRMGQLYSP
jgi:hypothetical protein